MKSLVEWLGTVECRAHEIYGRAAVHFGGDAPLAAFLRDLASDELSHVEFMRAAEKVLDDESLEEAPVALDASTREELEAPFRRVEEALSAESLSVDDLLDCIVSTEFSEWNDLHLFVMNKLQSKGPSSCGWPPRSSSTGATSRGWWTRCRAGGNDSSRTDSFRTCGTSRS